MKYLYHLYLTCILVSSVIVAQASLISGPIVGAVSDHDAYIWIAYKGASNNVVALMDATNKEVKFPAKLDYIKNKKGVIAMTLYFTELRPNTNYKIVVKMNDVLCSDAVSLTTTSSNTYDDVSFLAGSCFLQWPNGFGKMIFPGGHKRILKPMASDSIAQFNLWLGDNTYLLFGQWNSFEKNFKRHLKNRITNPLYENYLMSRPNYAIWDDHDFGPNDGSGAFELKDTSLNIFTHFWPNGSFGLPGTKGIFSKFTKGDCDFFLLDDRYYRSDEHDTNGVLLGEAQMQWLKIGLMNSKATFKFIVTGSQVLNKQTEKECWMSDFPGDTKSFLSFINEQQISGVVFITGDRHLTRVVKDTTYCSYPLYDLTISPVLSILTKETEIEKNNPQVIPHTLVQGKHNYARFTIRGDAKNRVCNVECFDEYGIMLWKLSIPAEELK